MQNKLIRFFYYLFFILVPGPVLYLLGHSFFSESKSDQETWLFIVEQMLWELTANTFSLGLYTIVFTLLIGFAQAIITEMLDIRYRKFLRVLFVCPLIFPIYVYSFVFVGSLEYSSAFPTLLRDSLGLNLLDYFNVKSAFGVGLVFSLALSPYTYLFFVQGIQNIHNSQVLSARSLGLGNWRTIKQVILPQLVPWGVSASIIIFLEVLCEFGGVSIFNYDTFSTAIYHAWSSLFSINSAVKLAFLPTIIAIVLYFGNQIIQGQKVLIDSSLRLQPFIKVAGFKKVMITIVTIVFVIVSVIFPVVQLLVWSSSEWVSILAGDYWPLILQTLEVGVVFALCIVTFSLLITLSCRLFLKTSEIRFIVFQKIGYALPGAIIAVAVLVVFSSFGLNFSIGLSLIALGLGLVIRFYPIALEVIEQAYAKIPTKFDWNGLSIGLDKTKVYSKIHFPLLRPAIGIAFIMAMIEVMKEMTITLILRPYGVNTLATKIFEYTSEGEWERAAFPSVLLLFTGIIALVIKELGRVGKSQV